jgi:ELWxxDGT repeat protein
VARSGPDLQGGYNFTVAFLQSPLLVSADVVGNATFLTGTGAALWSYALQKPGVAAEFVTDRRIGGLAMSKPEDFIALALRGNVTNVAEALDLVSFVPAADWSGRVSVWAHVRDSGVIGDEGPLSSSGVLSVDVLPVNDPPVIFWRGQVLNDGTPAFVTDEDEDTALDELVEGVEGGLGLVLEGLRIRDVDSGAASLLAVNVTSAHGAFTYKDCRALQTVDAAEVAHEDSVKIPSFPFAVTESVCRTPTADVSAFATLHDLNTWLSELIYRPDPDYHGGDMVRVVVTDEAGAVVEETLQVLVRSVNDGPTIILNGTGMGTLHNDTDTWEVPVWPIDEDVPTVIAGISIMDVDSSDVLGNDLKLRNLSDFTFLEVTVSVFDGLLTVWPGTDMMHSWIIQGDAVNGSRQLTAKGGLDSLNQGFLSGLTYTGDPQWFGVDLLTIFVTDLGNSGQGGPLTHLRHALLEVHPVNDAPRIVLPHDGGVEPSTLRVCEDVVGVIGADCCDWAEDEVAMTLFRNGSWQHISRTGIQVRDLDQKPPTRGSWVLPNTTTVIRYDLKTDLDRTRRRSPAEYDPDLFTVTLTVAHGNISLNRVATKAVTFLEGDGFLDERVTFRGKLEDVNRALLGAMYVSQLDWNSERPLLSPAGLELEAIAITVTDTGTSNLSDSTVLHLYVLPANDAPVLGVPGSYYDEVSSTDDQLTRSKRVMRPYYTVEDQVLPLTGISVRDVDVDETPGGLLQVTIYASNGTVSIAPSQLQVFTVGDGVDDKVLAFKATLENANLALASLYYRANTDFFGTDTVIVSVEDLGNTGKGPWCAMSVSSDGVCNLHDTINIPVVIKPAVDPVVIIVPPDVLEVPEDEDLRVWGLEIRDLNVVPRKVDGYRHTRWVPKGTTTFDDYDEYVEGPEAEVTNSSAYKLPLNVEISVDHGSFSLRPPYEGLTFSVGDGEADAFMAFSGTVDSINVALRECLFRGTPDYNTKNKPTAAIRITAWEQQEAEAGRGKSVTTEVIRVRILAVNDPPMIQLPSEIFKVWPETLETAAGAYVVDFLKTQVIEEDTDLLLPGFQVTDVDAMEEYDGAVQLSLDMEHGQVLLGPTTGLFFAKGSDGSSSLAIRGALDDVNRALAELRYRPDPDWFGYDTLVIKVDDLGFSGEGEPEPLTFLVQLPIRVLPVNDPPLWDVPPHPVVAGEDEFNILSGIQVHDVDATDDGTFRVELSVDFGLIGFDTLPETVSLDGVPTPPAVSAAADGLNQTVDGAGVVYPLLKALMYRTVSLAGNLSDINEALRSLAYVPGYHWTAAYSRKNDVLHLTASDGYALDALYAHSEVVLNVVSRVNDGPRLYVKGAVYRVEPCRSQEGDVSISRPTQPAAVELQCRRTVSVERIVANEDELVSLQGTRVEDADLDETFGSMIEISLEAQHGTIILSQRDSAGATFYEGSAGVVGFPRVTFRSSLIIANRILATASYQGDKDYFGADLITVRANDLGFSGTGGPKTDNQTIPVTLLPVNDPPEITLPEGRLFRVYEDFKMILPPILITDADWDAQRRYFGNQVVNCTREDLACYNSSFRFEHSSPRYSGGYVEVQLRMHHGRVMLASSTGLTFGKLDPVMQSENQIEQPVELGAAWVQDPVGWVTAQKGEQGEEGAAGLWWKDVTFHGRLDHLNTALAAVTYWPDLNWNSFTAQDLDRIEVIVRDSQFNSSYVVTKDIYLDVLAQNDPPIILVPGAIRHESLAEPDGVGLVIREVSTIVTNEDEDFFVSEVMIRDVDVNEVTTGIITVNILAKHGAVTITFHGLDGMSASPVEPTSLGPDLSGLIFTVGDGNRDQQMAFRGSLDTVNLALSSLRFYPETDYFGTGASITITAEDSGAFGSEDPPANRRTQITIPVAVRPLNDPPLITVPTDEDGTQELDVEEEQEVQVVGTFYHNLSRNAISALGYTSSAGFELWRSEGVRSDYDAGEWGAGDLDWRYHLVRDMFEGQDSSSPRFFCLYNGLLYFQATDGKFGTELWRTDGTRGGTVMVKDIMPGPGGSFPSDMVVFNGHIYFQADGIDTTWMLQRHLTDGCDGFRQSGFDSRVFFAVAQNTTWDPYKTYDCPYGYHWATTAEAYHLFTGSNAADNPSTIKARSQDQPTYFDQCGWQGFHWGSQYRRHFRFKDSSTTLAYKDVGKRDSTRPDVDRYGRVTEDFAGIVCVVGDEALVPNAPPTADCKFLQGVDACKTRAGPQLWRSDGTERGTHRVDDVSEDLKTRAGAAPAYLTPFQGALYFQAFSDKHGTELFRSTGTEGGMDLVKDIHPGFHSSRPSFLVVCNGYLLFSADDGAFGTELWRSDGKLGYFGEQPYEGFHATGGAGTKMVKDIRPGPSGSMPVGLTPNSKGNLLFFQADDGIHGAELWISDGSQQGTRMVTDIFRGPQSSYPSYLTPYGSKMYFQANDGIFGAELWESDGTAKGTMLVKDIRLGSLGSFPSYLTVWTTGDSKHKTLLAFFASDGYGTGSWRQREGVRGSQLWLSEGPRETTRKAFTQTENHLYVDFEAMDATWPPRMAAYKNTLYFTASQGVPTSADFNPVEGLLPANEELVTGIDQAFVITDVDQEPDGVMTMSLSCGKCNLTVVNPPVDVHLMTAPTGPSIAMNGTIFALNRAMRNLRYRGLADQIGWDTIAITVRDSLPVCAPSMGDTAISLLANHSLCDVEAIANEVDSNLTVYISPVNHPPSIKLGQANVSGRVDEVISLGAVTLDDPDVEETRTFDVYGVGHEAALSVQMTSTYGRLSLDSRDLISFVEGNGILDKRVHFLGPLEAVNRALKRVEYQFFAGDYELPDIMRMEGYRDNVTVVVDDNGHSGRGGPLTAMAQIHVDVRSIYAPPSDEDVGNV